MNLIDLLVRELDEWPEDVSVITQDCTGDITAFSNNLIEIEHGIWCPISFDDTRTVGIFEYEYADDGRVIADDHQTAIITRSQWESAKLAQ